MSIGCQSISSRLNRRPRNTRARAGSGGWADENVTLGAIGGREMSEEAVRTWPSVTPAERTAAASVTAVPRSLAAAASPALAGAVFAAGQQALPFIACGVLKILYDLALLAAFRRVKPPEER